MARDTSHPGPYILLGSVTGTTTTTTMHNSNTIYVHAHRLEPSRRPRNVPPRPSYPHITGPATKPPAASTHTRTLPPRSSLFRPMGIGVAQLQVSPSTKSPQVPRRNAYVLCTRRPPADSESSHTRMIHSSTRVRSMISRDRASAPGGSYASGPTSPRICRDGTLCMIDISLPHGSPARCPLPPPRHPQSPTIPADEM